MTPPRAQDADAHDQADRQHPPRPPAPLGRLPVLLCLAMGLFPTALQAQTTEITAVRQGRPYADTLHALIVFVRFLDDQVIGDPAVRFREWPLYEDPTRLPAFARTLLADRPHPPFVDSSLTAYFHRQSNGRFVLYGDVVERVHVSLHPESAYHAPSGGYGFLTAEVLDRLDADGFDFTRYDYNADGRLDYLFLIIRGDTQRDAKRFTYTGISCLDARCGGGISGGRPPRDLMYDGIRVDWLRSGAILLHRTPGNIIPHRYLVRLMAHELGHDLWHPFFTHVPALTDNDVPQTSNRGRGTDTIGYVLMAGAGGGADARGDETISAFERDLLGWIDCPTLSGPAEDVTVGDLYTTGDCRKIILAGGRNGQVLYVSNRQRIGPFDVLRLGGRDGQFEMGQLRTTGLLVMLVNGLRLDVLPADNSLDLSARNAPYRGDLYGPGSTPQITPWTRPNTSGYTRYPESFSPSWQALDDIRYTGAAGREMAFHYVDDFRRHPVIRADSWMGDETRGFEFPDPVVVTGGSTLHVETTLTMRRGLRVDPGARVIVAPDARLQLPSGSVLTLGPNATMIVDGTLVLEGARTHRQSARLLRGPDGRIFVPVPRDPR